MSRETEPTEETGDDVPADADGFDRQLLSDLSVNLFPIVVILAFVALFGLLSPTGEGGDPLLLFHAALVGGVLLVSIVAGWLISCQDDPLEGSAAGVDDGPERD